MSNDDFSDDDLAERGLPPIAFADNTCGLVDSISGVVCIKRGEMGCYTVVTQQTAQQLNDQHGVSDIQREAMLAGSLFGWACRAAYPSTWEKHLGDPNAPKH